ncbi:MAG: hypothetical protein AAGJ40_09510 [Planctomycetota bacterium]
MAVQEMPVIQANKSSEHGFLRWFGSAFNSLRHFVAIVLFAVASTLFALPLLVALVVFALAAIVCLAIAAIGCIAAGIAVVPMLAIQPNGVKAIVKAAKECA